MSGHPIVYGVSHIDVPVADLARAERFYTEGLGFPRKDAGEGFVDLDASSIAIRLFESPKNERRVMIRVQAADVGGVHRALVALGGRSVSLPTRTATEELGSVRDPDDNTLTVWRPLTEDEYVEVPALPTRTEWAPEAEVLLKSLLLAVPALFRGLARRKIVRLAEEMFAHRRITPRDAVRAYILASARITRYRLEEPLRRHGFDPQDFAADFAAD